MKKRTILIWILISISINLFAVSAETTFFDNLNDAFIIGNPEQEGSESTKKHLVGAVVLKKHEMKIQKRANGKYQYQIQKRRMA